MQDKHSYLLDTKRKKFLYSLGLFTAVLYAIFCGISLTGYVVLTFGTGGGALIAGIIGALVCSSANLQTALTKIPETFVDLLGGNGFFKRFFAKDGTEIPDPNVDLFYRFKPWHVRLWRWMKAYRKRFALGVGIFLSIVSGLAIGGQGYGGITAAVMAFMGVGSVTPMVMAIGLTGAVIFFFAFWAITLKAIILELQKHQWIADIKNTVKELFKSSKDRSATRARIEGAAILLLLISVTPLAILGVVTAMMASHMGFMQIFTDIPNVSQTTLSFLNVASWIFVVGLASLGQLPFYLKTTLKTVKVLGRAGLYQLGRIFGYQAELHPDKKPEKFTRFDKFMYGIRTVNAGFSALYSYVGGGANQSFIATAGAIGGVMNSFSAPEKIGGTSFSDIGKNFRAGAQKPSKQALPTDWGTYPEALSGQAAFSEQSPLVNQYDTGYSSKYAWGYGTNPSSHKALTPQHNTIGYQLLDSQLDPIDEFDDYANNPGY